MRARAANARSARTRRRRAQAAGSGAVPRSRAATSAGDVPLGQGEGRSADAGGLARRPDAGHVGALLGVDATTRVRRASSRAAEGLGELGLRQHAVADGEGVAGDAPLGAGPDASPGVEPRRR